MMSKNDWVFAKVSDPDLKFNFNLDEFYRKSLNSREGLKNTLQAAASAALENLMSWERIARTNGFRLRVFTDRGLGAPVPHIEGNVMFFCQAYGVEVVDAEAIKEGGER